MTIARVQVALTGTALAGAGVSTFYTRNVTPGSLPGAISTFFSSCASALPSGLTWTVPNTGDTIDEATGAIAGTWTGTGGATAAGSGTGNFTLGSGGRVEWRTSVPVFGHHPRGRTFMVPIVNLAMGADGRIASGTVTQFQNAANALITAGAGDLVVWVRPRKNYVGKNGPLPDRSGAIVPIVSASIPTTPTALRSRRY